MNRHTFVAALAVVSSVGSPRSIDATNQASTARPITRAAASLELIPGQSRVIVRVKNISNVSLEAWRYEVSYDLGSGPASMEVTWDAGLDPDYANGGAIRPLTERSQVLALPGVPASVSATLNLLMFSDGSSEGSAEYRNEVLLKRERRGAMLTLWIDALQSVSGMRGAEAKSHIETLRRSDSRYTPDPSDSWARATDLQVKEALSGSVVDLPTRLTALLTKYRTQRERALRHKRR